MPFELPHKSIVVFIFRIYFHSKFHYQQRNLSHLFVSVFIFLYLINKFMLLSFSDIINYINKNYRAFDLCSLIVSTNMFMILFNSLIACIIY